MSPSSSAADAAVRPSGRDTAPDRDPAEPVHIPLPDRMDFAAARDLHARLSEVRGAPVILDGAAVVFGGGLAAQVLLSASLEWAAAGDDLQLTVSPALRNDLQRLDVLGRFPTLIEGE